VEEKGSSTELARTAIVARTRLFCLRVCVCVCVCQELMPSSACEGRENTGGSVTCSRLPLPCLTLETSPTLPNQNGTHTE
jgi:hypothetical protein